MINRDSNWLVNPGKELLLIILPLFLPVLIVVVFRNYFDEHTEVTTMWWLVLILMIDVSHVYSTLFRFYWEKGTLSKYRSLLIIIPAVSFVIALSIHLFDPFLFWRILAYVALYHFVRQQYGFLRLYSRKQNQGNPARFIDAMAIYSATLYPVAYWHLHLTENLSWFVPHDFISIPVSKSIDGVLLVLYLVIIATYVCKEVYYSKKNNGINIPKNGIVVGTYLSWYAGIILFHGDLAFTLLNVVAHGIPYMGLIWLYGTKKSTGKFSFGVKGALIFAVTLLALSYFEESIWDTMIWRDHGSLFPFFRYIEPLIHPWMISIVVSLLVLPQITHYVLDGFIWRFSKDNTARIN